MEIKRQISPTHVAFLLFFLFASLSNCRVLPRQLQASSSPPALMAPSPTDSQRVTKVHHKHFDKELIIFVSLSALAVIAIALSAIIAWISCRKHHKDSTLKGLSLAPVFNKLSSLKIVHKKEVVEMIDYSLLDSSTNNFSEDNILGEGGFGCVYKASFNEGSLAAVKKLDGGGLESERMFDNELNFFGRIRHPNIVSLLGYCIHGESRFFVYEFLPNGSLESLLHGSSHGSSLTWHLRMKIALDTARGLEYLHETCNPPVIHRDLKSSNILLDAEFNAKISDFGLAISDCNQNKASVKLSGTLGYVAPEYVLDGKLTEKSDVYAFGVVLLELLLGRKPVEKMSPTQNQSIVTWAMPQLTDRSKLPSIVDPMIRDTMDLKHLYQVAAVAVLCVQPEASYRPLITDVLHSLIPLVPVELGGTLKFSEPSPHRN
ncbi:hypothetical protein M5K25_015668 [Dendrobium thyrsiflorum]|uniref:Protein kinase domain-containing protein n=1 Tax=Dendrobium thyrsiflorum TaxID=117978 RepID=A0ABD0UR78_DENTH